VIVDSVLTNAKAYLSGQITDCSIAIEDSKIYKIGKETQMPQADQKIDLINRLVLPGLIDEHVHLRDEGRSYKEDFNTGTKAAVAGGFTTVLDMPNNDPVTNSTQNLQNRMMLAKRKIFVNVGFYSELSKNLADNKAIVEAGAVGFKLFMGNQVGGLEIDDDSSINEACKSLGELKVPLAVHAEDHQMLAANETALKKSKKSALSDFLRAHTEAIEIAAIQRLMKLSQQSKVHLHFCHVTSQGGLAVIAQAKKIGRLVTCEVTPNHLLLTNDDLPRLGGMAIMAPPLRDKSHREALWKGIKDGTVDTLGSDHAPHSIEEKNAANVWEIKVGDPGLETTLPLMLTMVHQQRLSLNQIVGFLAEKPSEIYGLSDRGKIETNKTADLTVVDYNCKFKIDASKFYSKAKFSPYNSWEVWGKPVKTFVGGQLIFDEGQIVSKAGSGSVLRRGVG
jgi:dihydroorotase (multifunctional complex type)